MYLWKVWNDSRSRLAVYGLAGLATGAIIGLDAFVMYRDYLSHFIVRFGSRDAIQVLANGYTVRFTPEWVGYMANETLWQFLALAAIWVGLTLGSSTVGKEFGVGGAEFLMTRPRPRRTFVWTEWAFTLFVMFLLLLLPVVSASLFLWAMEPDARPNHYWLLSPFAFLIAASVYGLTQLLTMLTGSAGKGLTGSFAIVLVFLLLPGALNEWWHFVWFQDFQSWTFRPFNWLVAGGRSSHPFPADPLVFWILLVLPFPMLAQWRLEKKEL